jgi:hypothetical protein
MTIAAIVRSYASPFLEEARAPEPRSASRVAARPATPLEVLAAPIHYPPELFGASAPAPPPRGNVTTAGHEEEPPTAVSGPGAGSTAGDGAPARPHEVPILTTTPSVRQIVSAVKTAWPELTEQGARTLAAQYMAETDGGRFCFNWNVGNIRARPNEPHVYLERVWEVGSVEGARAEVARAPGLVHIATDAEVRQHGWSCPPGKAILVFEGRHPRCRFRAYRSLADGVKHWTAHLRGLAKKFVVLLFALNQGDTVTVANTLHEGRYYTAAPEDYARAMAVRKAEIDRVLGPVR